MRHRRICRTVLLALAGSFVWSTVAIAADVGKGVLLLRRGAANTDANYEKDDRDPNGKLMGVSIQCNNNVTIPTSAAKEQQLIGAQKGYANRMTMNSTCVINKGAAVKTDAQKGNPNHCLIDSIKIGDIKGCWQ